jgi:isoquinoline 1-oxidoreductase beta subunit
MEAPAASARITGGKCEVWGCFQSPQAARDLVAKRLDMPVENVTVYVTLLGGGFGRKSKPDYGIEAAVLSKAMDGKPVKVVWTRDDDLHNDYFHTVSVEHLEAGVDAQGKPVAWLHRSVAPTIVSTFDAARQAGGGLGARHGRHQRPFSIPNVRIENPEATAHTRIGWFRSVSNIPHAFAVQSFVAELAAGGRPRPEGLSCSKSSGPRESYRRRCSATSGTMASRRSAIPSTRAPDAAWRSWQRKRAAGAGDGEGQRPRHRRALQLRQLRRGRRRSAVDAKGQLTIPRVDIAVDCGATVNPDRVRAQMEGAASWASPRRPSARSRSRTVARSRTISTLRSDAHGRSSARDPRAHRSRRLREADGRRRRAGRAADAPRCATRFSRRRASGYDSCRYAIS